MQHNCSSIATAVEASPRWNWWLLCSGTSPSSTARLASHNRARRQLAGEATDGAGVVESLTQSRVCLVKANLLTAECARPKLVIRSFIFPNPLNPEDRIEAPWIGTLWISWAVEGKKAVYAQMVLEPFTHLSLHLFWKISVIRYSLHRFFYAPLIFSNLYFSSGLRDWLGWIPEEQMAAFLHGGHFYIHHRLGFVSLHGVRRGKNALLWAPTAGELNSNSFRFCRVCCCQCLSI